MTIPHLIRFCCGILACSVMCSCTDKTPINYTFTNAATSKVGAIHVTLPVIDQLRGNQSNTVAVTHENVKPDGELSPDAQPQDGSKSAKQEKNETQPDDSPPHEHSASEKSKFNQHMSDVHEHIKRRLAKRTDCHCKSTPN